MRAVFMGTPEIAATVLKSVLASRHEVIAVVTQTDKPKGRGHEMASATEGKRRSIYRRTPCFKSGHYFGGSLRKASSKVNS